MIIIFMLALSFYTMVLSTTETRGTPRQATVTFTNATAQAGLAGVGGNSFAWGDYNNDGYEDLLISGRRLFRNNGPPGWNFTEVTSSAGLTSGTGGGVWGDYDNDGDLDIYSVGRNSDTLYRNNGDGTFTDVTTPAGNIRDQFPTIAAGWGDYDQDGYLDLYLANGEDWNDPNYIHYPNHLFQNNGDGTFTNTTVASGVVDTADPRYSRGVNWGDYNNDGWLDIHVSNYRLCANTLWQNNRDGTFTDVAGDKDVKGVWDPDRYYDAQAQATYGDGTWGPTYGHTIGSAWADYDNDGDIDMWTSNLVHKYVGPTSWPSMPYDIRGYVCDDSKMYNNYGAPYYNFSDARPTTGIPFKPIGGSGTYQGDELFDGVAWGDFDNDGDLDLWLPQVYDLNYAYSFLYEQDGVGTGQFTDRASELGMRVYNTYAGCWADYDNDGDLDLLTAGKSPYVAEGQGKYEIHLYQNSGNSNNYLKISLNGTTSNRYAIGARVKVTVGSVTMMREVEGGMGCNGHQNSLVLHFGLGTAAIVDEVEVRWPNGRLQFLDNVAVNQLLNLTEPSDPLPTVTSVQLSPTSPLEDQQVTFTASVNAGGATLTNLQWDYEADNVFDYESTGFTAQHTYTTGGLKHARLRVLTNQNSGIDYYPIEFTVTNLAPVAEFMANVTYHEDEVAVFNASQSTDTASDLLMGFEYYWKFGDGVEMNWSANHTVSNTYRVEGPYIVNLSVRDIDGDVGYQEQTISVQNVPPVIENLPDVIGYEDQELNFTANTTDTQSDLDSLWFKWEFGDGTDTIKWSQIPTATHTYTEKGNYSAKFIARDDDLVESVAFQNITILNPAPTCTITQIDNNVNEDELGLFDGEGTDTVSDGSSLQYYWDFGDNTTTVWSTSILTTHAFTDAGNYSVRLYVKDDDSSQNYSEVLVAVQNVAPTCAIETEDMTVDEDELIDFEGTGTDTESDLPSLLFSWGFGDGNQSNWSADMIAQHTYILEDEYEVTLYIKDDNELMVASENIEVKVINVVPEVRGTASQFEVNEGEAITFTVTKTDDTASDLPFIRYEWNFKGGSGKVEGAEANHTYYESDEYNVELTIYDDDNDHSTYTLKTITVNNFPPIATFTIDKTDAEVNEKFYFSAWNSTDSPWELENLRYLWKFGDGKSGNGINVTHVYKSAKRFKVELSVYDDDDEVSKYTRYVNVTEPASVTEKDEGLGDTVLFAAIGGVVILIILIIFAFLMLQKRKKEAEEGEEQPEIPEQPVLPMPPLLFPPPGQGMPPLPFPPPFPMPPPQVMKPSAGAAPGAEMGAPSTMPMLKSAPPHVPALKPATEDASETEDELEE